MGAIGFSIAVHHADKVIIGQHPAEKAPLLCDREKLYASFPCVSEVNDFGAGEYSLLHTGYGIMSKP